MAQSSDKKQQVSAVMNKSTGNVLRNGLKKAQEHYAPVLAEWGKTTPKQREEFLQHSPILSELIAFCKQWEVDTWQR